jgi:hypothetical protein
MWLEQSKFAMQQASSAAHWQSGRLHASDSVTTAVRACIQLCLTSLLIADAHAPLTTVMATASWAKCFWQGECNQHPRGTCFTGSMFSVVCTGLEFGLAGFCQQRHSTAQHDQRTGLLLECMYHMSKHTVLSSIKQCTQRAHTKWCCVQLPADSIRCCRSSSCAPSGEGLSPPKALLLWWLELLAFY